MSATSPSRTFALLATLALLTGCNDTSGPPRVGDLGGEPGQISVVPRAATIEAGRVVRLHATLIDRLVEGGARSIAFDLLFDLPAANAEDDGTFGEAIRRAGNVVLAADQAVVEDRAYAVAQWTEPLPSLARHAAASGVVRIPYDPDGVLRRAQLGFDGRPSLALAIASREPGFQLPAGTDVSSRRA